MRLLRFAHLGIPEAHSAAGMLIIFHTLNQHGWNKCSVATPVHENMGCTFSDSQGFIFTVKLDTLEEITDFLKRIRAFNPDPLPRETPVQIFEDALRALDIHSGCSRSLSGCDSRNGAYSREAYCWYAIGYPDENSPVNMFQSSRESLERVKNWFGF